MLAGLAFLVLGCAATSPAGSPLGSAAGPSPTIGGAATGGDPNPPAGILRGAASEIPGTLGSWTLDGRGTDGPWLPAAALVERAVGQERLMARYADGAEIGAWSARAAPATDPRGTSTFGVGGRDEDSPPLSSVAIDPLPSGRWVLAVRLDRADGRGDATFYWLLAS